MNEFKNYVKKGIQPMRLYVEGEDLTNITVGEKDIIEVGGMIAKNPNPDENDWYIPKGYFNDNYRLVVEN